jgi:hypothetical protein
MLTACRSPTRKESLAAENAKSQACMRMYLLGVPILMSHRRRGMPTRDRGLALKSYGSAAVPKATWERPQEVIPLSRCLMADILVEIYFSI